MYDVAIKLNSTNRLVEILHLLNYLLKHSPSNFHAKLLCLQIFHILGCTLGAHKIYDSLDIKHVQLDSMGYIHCAHLPSTGIVSLSKPIYDQTLKFFTTSYKDSLEYLAMSYKFGSFSKLQEFMDFRERLSNSLHYSMISVEALLQEIVYFNGSYRQNYLQFKNMRIEPNQDRIDYSMLCDNRDLNVMLRWDPMFSDNQSFYEKVKEIEKENYTQDVELLRIRSNLLRLVAASVDLIHLPSDRRFVDSKEHNENDFLTAVENYKVLIANWRKNFSRLRKFNYRRTSSQYLVNLLQSRIFYMIQLPYEEIFGALGEFVYDLWMERESCKQHAKKTQNEIVNLKKIIEKLDVRNEIYHYRDLQSSLVGSVEVFFLNVFH
jgi:N-terminal acetyltransferase B complex non-catalytic subunit